MRTKTTIKQKNWILENYEDYTARQMSERLGISIPAVTNVYRSAGLRKMEGPGCFKKGNKAWNKGKKCSRTPASFSKGHIPATIKPVGSTRINNKGNIEIKYENKRRGWRTLHMHIWIQQYGEIPKDHLVIFKDGVNKRMFTVNDLELISRADNMRRNIKRRLKVA